MKTFKHLKGYQFKKSAINTGSIIHYYCLFKDEEIARLDVFPNHTSVDVEKTGIVTKVDWIYNVRTYEAHQHKGIASILMKWALRDGFFRRAKYVGLNCHEGRRTFYEKFGFVTLTPGNGNHRMLISYRGKQIVLQKVS